MTLEMKMQDIRQEGKSEGIEAGIKKGFMETARNFLRMGLSVEQVAQGTTLSIEQVRQLQKETAGAE